MRTVLILIVLGIALMTAGLAFASNTTTQTVSYEVKAINELTVSGNPGTLIIQTATAGSEPDSATDASTNYAFTSNQATRKITGQITTGGAMPTGLTLNMGLADPSVSGWSANAIAALSDASAITLASGGKGKTSSKTITYRLDATTAADVQTGSRVVTLTLTAGS